MSPIRRFHPAVSHCHITRGLGALRASTAVANAKAASTRAFMLPRWWLTPGALHPPARIDRLAPDDRLARPSLRQPRRHADRRRHLGRLGSRGLPARAGRGLAPRAARRRVPHLDGERAPLRRRPVALLLVPPAASHDDASADASQQRRASAPAPRAPSGPGSRSALRGPGAAVESTSSHSRPNRRGGSLNTTSSGVALRSTANESSTTGSPPVVVDPSSSPLRKTPSSRMLRVLPVALSHRPPVGPEPPRVGERRLARGRRRGSPCAGRPDGGARSATSRRVNSSSCSRRLVELPVEPRRLVVLAPGVVVAALGAAALVAAERSSARPARGAASRGSSAAGGRAAPGSRVVGRALDAAVPRAVVVAAVAVALEVRLVVLRVRRRRGRRG